jgi:hypothetical protein
MNRKRPFAEFRNIRTLPSGYQVAVTRKKIEFSKHFAGHTPKSLRLAMRYRDMLLEELPPKRRKEIPPRVLRALRLRQPVVGVFRYPERRFYQVSYRDGRKGVRTRTFSWRTAKDELRAYAAAIRFRKSLLRRR